MKKGGQPGKRNKPEKHLAEFEAAVTRLKKRLEMLGVSEEEVLDAAAKVRERMLTEVYGMEAESSDE